MLSDLFVRVSVFGSEWVLYVLVFLSILSVGLILEKSLFFKKTLKNAETIRSSVRTSIVNGNWEAALRAVETIPSNVQSSSFEKQLVSNLYELQKDSPERCTTEVLERTARDTILRTRKAWEGRLAVLATIASNAPFIGLFGTVLGIITAFRDLSQQVETGSTAVLTSGLAEALVATGIGILVAIPAGVAFNLFQNRLRSTLAEAEALQNFLVARLVKNPSKSE